ncbi:hypothetical protein [Comamonas endophytica]|uniref:hypothetical protein n=1 Tax=Comamonas endophytica TaxID=2949090 RepID=UPI0036717117
MGDGARRAQLLDTAVGMRQKFSRFFRRIADFFFARRNAANREHAYVIEAGNRKTFEALSMPALGSRLNALEVEAEKRLAPSQRTMRGMALRQRLVQGENVVRALVAAELGFGEWHSSMLLLASAPLPRRCPRRACWLGTSMHWRICRRKSGKIIPTRRG